MDEFAAFAWIDQELEELASLGLRRSLTARSGPQSAVIEIEGHRLFNFGSNDYLGLASDRSLVRAAIESLGQWGTGGGASPLITGRTSLHAELERQLSEFAGTESALLFSSGFAAGAGVIAALVGEGDVILADAMNHASLIDGCRLSRAERRIYPHADTAALEAHLCQTRHYRRRLIVTDTLFSMDGDLAPLIEICRLADHFDAMILLDEAHALGVLGENGCGAFEHFGLGESAAANNVIRLGTLSKALGSAGGFVCGPQNVIDWIANRARSYVFSTAAPAVVIAAALAGLQIVRTEPHRRKELLQRATVLRNRLRNQGWEIGEPAAQIIPIVVGDPRKALDLATFLREQGYFVPPIRPPTVPAGRSLLRISLSWHHTEEMVEGLMRALEAISKRKSSDTERAARGSQA